METNATNDYATARECVDRQVRMTEQPTIHLSITSDEASILRYALDHGLCSISEAHPRDRALLRALIERLEAAEKKSKRARSGGGKGLQRGS